MTCACGSIIIVDEDPVFRTLVTDLLRRAGMATAEAGSAKEALELVRRELPALLLLDVCLPDLSGFEVCRELRDEFGDELPIIFVSGVRTESLDRAVGLLLGGDDYVIKPFDPDELLARIRRCLARSQGERVPRTPRQDPHGLTLRELDVLRQLAQGLRAAEIASALVISPKTVESHVQRVLAKLGVHSRAEAVAFAYRHGLIES